MHHLYLVCILFGMPSLHLFTFLMFFKSCSIIVPVCSSWCKVSEKLMPCYSWQKYEVNNRCLASNLHGMKSLCTLWGAQQQHTLTYRFTPRPHSSSLTCASTVSNQVVARITTVGGCLSVGCSNDTKLAIGWDIWNSAWYNC